MGGFFKFPHFHSTIGWFRLDYKKFVAKLLHRAGSAVKSEQVTYGFVKSGHNTKQGVLNILSLLYLNRTLPFLRTPEFFVSFGVRIFGSVPSSQFS